MKESDNNPVPNELQRRLKFLNVVRVFPDNLDFTIAEIRRQHEEVGLTDFALSLSFHPTGTPASRNAEVLVSRFKAVKEALADTPSIHIGVLLQSTLGHGWSGPVPLTGEPWQRIVDVKGAVSSRMCPTDKEFRQYVLNCVEGVMKVGPAFLLLDDDFGLRLNECFCPNHIAMFNKATGVERSFDEVVAMMKERPKDDPEVKLFSEQRGRLAVDFAREIRAVIDKYDDSIPCTMCTPGLGHGFVNDVTHVLAGRNGKPSARVNNAIYGSNNPNNLLILTTTTNRIRHVFKDVHELVDEADTFPQNYYSENAALFNAHLVNAILNGLDGAKLWMFEFEMPRDIHSQSRYERIFRQYRGFYEELYKTLEGIEWLGVKSVLTDYRDMLHPLQMSQKLYAADWNSLVFGPLGIPIAYDEAGGNGVFALNKDIVGVLSDDELTALFKRNVLIDSEAAKLLDKRGFGKYMGVRVNDDPSFFFQAEHQDGMISPTWLMWDASAAELVCLSDKTHVASWCMDTGLMSEAKRISPCMTYFTNELGGRVVTLAWSSNMPNYKILKNERRRILLDALDFLNGGMFEMSLETLHQAIVRHGKLTDGRELLAMISLALDEEPQIRLRKASCPKSVEKLLPDGRWASASFTHENGVLIVDEPLTCCKPVALRLVVSV